jgi:hypothetical protein
MTEAEITAVHEAGHVTANLLLGLRFDKVTLTPPQVWFGRHVHKGRHLALRRAVCHLAGPAAVMMVTGNGDGVATSDWQHAREVLADMANAPPIASVHAAAMRLLAQHRCVLTGVAAQLLARGDLSYVAVLGIARKT